MLKYLAKLNPFKPRVKKIAFIDGDQPIWSLLNCYEKYVKGTGAETHFIRCQAADALEPKVMRGKHTEINRIFVPCSIPGKETVDKFISAYIQRALAQGYTDITVISSDYDFIDIFAMAMQIDPTATQATFRLVVPKPRGRMTNMPEKLMNIEIVMPNQPVSE